MNEILDTNSRFKGNVVMVTGAARGIGFAILKRFLDEGACGVLNDVTSLLVNEGLNRLGSESRDRVLGCVADVSVADQVSNMVSQVVQKWGRVDFLVNNAGTYPNHLVLEMSVDEWDRVMNINAKGTFLVSQAVARHMVEKKIRGQIINIASGSYRVARVGSAHYCASKAACVMFTKVLAMELAPNGIRVNAISPGLIQVDSMNLQSEYIEATLHQIPMGRLGTPHDVADVAVGLAAMTTGYITGAVIDVDGGLALGRYGIPHS